MASLPANPLRRSLGTLSLVFILYFTTSGGPYTTETLVKEVGPGLAITIMLLVPIVWSIPEVLIIGELASMLPLEGGYYKWVQRAFGDFWAFQNGWLTWMYSLVDMAIYPVLFNQYLAFFTPHLSGPAQWAIALAVIWGATAINLLGALRVGETSVVTGSFIFAAFLVVAIAAATHMSHAPWVPFAAPSATGLGGLAVGLSIALWNYIGWDNASTVQGEVHQAGRSYPRALAFALPLVVVGNMLPLVTTLGATDWTTWTEGGWPAIARSVGGVLGPWLALWVAIGGMVSALSLFNALLLSYSRIPFVMAADGLLPRALSKADSRGTPRNAVLISAVAYSAFVLVPFGRLVVADVVLYALALSLEFAALVRLRVAEPGLRGPFRIPLGWRGVTALAVLPMLILVFVIGVSFRDGEYGLPAMIGAGAAVALGPVLFRIVSRRRWTSTPAVADTVTGDLP